MENLRTHSKLTKKSLLDVIFQKKMFFFEKKKGKNEFGESPNSLQTQKNMRSQLFFEKNMRSTTQKNSKKSCERIFFFEFGESLEILQTHVFPIFFFKKKILIFLKNNIKQRFLCEFGVSLEILQTLSKLAPNSQRNLCLISLIFF